MIGLPSHGPLAGIREGLVDEQPRRGETPDTFENLQRRVTSVALHLFGYNVDGLKVSPCKGKIREQKVKSRAAP